ncbi:asparaginase [Ancylobacter sp. Lp-2]|uniref:asparaginase n=1 Tax=Ancylobacter sp. Lp-2 TaxID=2881339 RepID=UPI001E36C2C5|nr:asparaginase [Ancylobacter sp. Lp-2]MCB4767456.1 asparaginase [Ancylobacter sp. Lp-2]
MPETSRRPHLLALSLGGTITMTASAAGGIAPTLGAADLVAAVPALAEIAEIEARSPFRVGSSSLTLANIAEVAAEIRAAFADGVDGALVIQGTDTIEETAFALDLMVRDDRPVVVIGAMRGPQQPGADGPANLLAGAIVAASPEARGLGTLVVLNDEIHAARYVRKGHSALTSAFVSDNGGPLGLVVEGRARLFSRVGPLDLPDLLPARGATADIDLPPVALVKIGMGDDGRLLPALPGLGYRGAVIEGAGAGHVPGVMAEAVGALAGEMPVVLASRTLGGPVFECTYGYPGSEIDLIARGVLPAGLLSALKARLTLVLALKAGFPREAVAGVFAAFR